MYAFLKTLMFCNIMSKTINRMKIKNWDGPLKPVQLYCQCMTKKKKS